MKKRVFILCMLLIWAGCASMPEKPAAPAETVFYPPPPERPRLQFLHSISGDRDLGKKRSAFQTFLVGNPRYQLLGEPYDVAASKGRIYIMDRMYKTIVTLDLASQEMSFLNDHGIGKLGDPSGMWVSEEGFKYVADMQRKQVVTFDQDDNFSKTYGGPEIFEKPVDVAVYGKRLYGTPKTGN